MSGARAGGRKQILVESVSWKGGEVGQRFKDQLFAAAERGGEVYCIYDGFANLVVSPVFKRFPVSVRSWPTILFLTGPMEKRQS